MAFIGTAVASLGASVGGSLGIAGPMTFGSSLALGSATLAAGGGLLFGASKMMKATTPDMPSLQPLPPAPSIEEARVESRADVLETLRRKRAGTILTSPQGLLSTSDVTGKILLGS